MPYTRERAIDFWFEFDDVFQDHVPPNVGQLYSRVLPPPDGIDFYWNRWMAHRAGGTYPAGYAEDVRPFAADLVALGNLQLAIMDKYFPGDPDALQRAFEDFGQGVLYDAGKTADGRFRRSLQDRVHQMDGGAATMVGYHRWHTIIRATVLGGGDEARWLRIDRNVGLAWAIQKEAKPKSSKPNNPGLADGRLAALREVWTTLSADQLDAAFDEKPQAFFLL